jgi:hypothetical protein
MLQRPGRFFESGGGGRGREEDSQGLDGASHCRYSNGPTRFALIADF